MRIRHLVVDAHGCSGPLDDVDTLIGLLRQAARAVGAHEYGHAQARYVPHGVTVVLILAESHMILSTWPEHRLCLVEILLCNDAMDPDIAWRRMEATLRPDRVERHELERGHPTGPGGARPA